MRAPDIKGDFADAWKVPLVRLIEWVESHQELIHADSRGDLFRSAVRDLWYVRSHRLEDLEPVPLWLAVTLRELTGLDVHMYAEAVYEVALYRCVPSSQTPAVNGDGLFDWDLDKGPEFLYQFHGVTETQALALGNNPRKPITFAQYLVEMTTQGIVLGGTEQDLTARLSSIVNGIRQAGLGGEPPLRALEVGRRTGLIVELEDGSSTTLPIETLTL